MQEDLHDRPLYRRFAELGGAARLPDETTILRLKHLLEEHDLAPEVLRIVNVGLAARGLLMKKGTVVDATLIAAPSSTKNSTGQRASEMHQTKKGDQRHHCIPSARGVVMMQTGHVVGAVGLRPGDGPKMPTPLGPVEIETSRAEATLRWVGGETHGVATMPLADFKRYGIADLSGQSLMAKGVCSGEVQRGGLNRRAIANRRSGRRMRDLHA
jgi:hypothetical protein